MERIEWKEIMKSKAKQGQVFKATRSKAAGRVERMRACGDLSVNGEKLEGVEGTGWWYLIREIWASFYDAKAIILFVSSKVEMSSLKKDTKTRTVLVSLVEYKGTCKKSEGTTPECCKWKKAAFSSTEKAYNTFTRVYWLFNSAAPPSKSHLK